MRWWLWLGAVWAGCAGEDVSGGVGADSDSGLRRACAANTPALLMLHILLALLACDPNPAADAEDNTGFDLALCGGGTAAIGQDNVASDTVRGALDLVPRQVAAVVTICPGRWPTTGVIIDSDLTIRAADPTPGATVLVQEANSDFFDITSSLVTIEGVSIEGATSQVLDGTDTTLTLRDVDLVDISTTGRVLSLTDGDLIIDGGSWSNIEGNPIVRTSSVLDVTIADLTIDAATTESAVFDLSFDGPQGLASLLGLRVSNSRGTVVRVVAHDSGTTLSIRDSEFRMHRRAAVELTGGAAADATVNLTDCTFEDNDPSGAGAMISIANGASVLDGVRMHRTLSTIDPTESALDQPMGTLVGTDCDLGEDANDNGVDITFETRDYSYGDGVDFSHP